MDQKQNANVKLDSNCVPTRSLASKFIPVTRRTKEVVHRHASKLVRDHDANAEMVSNWPRTERRVIKFTPATLKMVVALTSALNTVKKLNVNVERDGSCWMIVKPAPKFTHATRKTMEVARTNASRTTAKRRKRKMVKVILVLVMLDAD
jgi:hypothetical protein